MTTLTVDLSRLAGPVLSGRNRGAAARAEYDLDNAEDRADIVQIVIPDNTYTVTSSFFLGLFGDSVRKCGSIGNFESKFRYLAPPFLIPVLRGHAGLALQSKKLFAKHG